MGSFFVLPEGDLWVRLSSFVYSLNVYLSASDKKASKKPDLGSG
jgi:hypothetical protein